MGLLFPRQKRNAGKNEAYRDSESDIYYFVAQSFAYFMAGIFIGMPVFVFSFFFTLGIDTTQTSVIDTNHRIGLIFMAGAFSLVGYMGMKGAFGYSFFEFFLGSYDSFLMLAVGIMETRITKKNWGQAILPFVYVAIMSAGFFSAAAFVKYSYDPITIDSFFKPSLLNAVQHSLAWAYVWESLIYTAIMLVMIFTCNSTYQYYSNLMPGTCTIFMLSVLQLYTTRLLPSFPFNWAWCYLTDTYDLLAIDVAAGFTGVVVSGVVYYVGYSRFFIPYWTEAFSTARVPYSVKRYVKLEDMENTVHMKAQNIIKHREEQGDPGAANYYKERAQTNDFFT